MCSYPTQVGHFWRHWMRGHYLTGQLDPGDRHIHLAKPVAKHTSVLNGTSGSYSRDNQREKWLSENNLEAPQQRISGEFISLTEEQSTARKASLDGKDAFTCWFLVRNWFTVIIESPAGLLKILVPFQTVSGASGAFPDGSVSQIIWCVRLEKPVDNKHLLSTFIFSCGWSPWQMPPWTQNFVNRISFKNRGQISRR